MSFFKTFVAYIFLYSFSSQMMTTDDRYKNLLLFISAIMFFFTLASQSQSSLLKASIHSTFVRNGKWQGLSFCFWLERILGSASQLNFPSPWATLFALRLDFFTAALTLSKKVLRNGKVVELKMLDYSDRMTTGISNLTLATDLDQVSYSKFITMSVCLTCTWDKRWGWSFEWQGGPWRQLWKHN